MSRLSEKGRENSKHCKGKAMSEAHAFTEADWLCRIACDFWTRSKVNPRLSEQDKLAIESAIWDLECVLRAADDAEEI